jgi:DNA-binding Lrp family transcriptional regulator
MERAYVLINCNSGYEESIIKELKKMDSIKEIHGTLGVYDIIAKVESENQEKLKEAIIGDIRKLTNIKSTLTLMGAGDIDKGENMAELIPDIIPKEKKPLEVPRDMNEDEEYDDEDDDFEEKKK